MNLRMPSAQKLLLIALTQRIELAMAASTAASAAASTATVLVAVEYGAYDPWTWVIGAFGAIVVYIKKEATTRIDAIANSAISVVLAGLLSPGITHYIGIEFSVHLSNPYPVAFLLSAAWPWIVPALLSLGKPGKK